MSFQWEPVAEFGQTNHHSFNHSSHQQNNQVDSDIPVLSLVSSIVSLVTASVAVVLYARKVFIHKVYPRSAVLDVLWWGLLLSVPASLNYAVCAILQLGNQLEVFCPVSLAILEFLFVPQLILQGTFFVFIALVASGRRLPVRWASRAAATALCCGLLITIVVLAILSQVPGGISSGTFLAWCWIPDPNEVPCGSSGSRSSVDTTDSASCMDQRDASVLMLAWLLGGLIWIFVSVFVGIVSLVYFAYRLRRYVKLGLLAEVKPAVKLRFLYFLYYLVGTVVLALPRLVLAQASSDPVMNRIQAFLQPSFAASEAIVLLASERHWLLTSGSTSSRRGLLAQSTELDPDPHRADRQDPVKHRSNPTHSKIRSPSAGLAGAGEMSSGGVEIHPSTGRQLHRLSDVEPLLGQADTQADANERLGYDSSSCFLGFDRPERDEPPM
jgi:hypothetical protein